MKLIIDCSVLWYKNLHGLKAKDYVATTGLEMAEYTKSLTKDILRLVKRFQADEVILGVDSKEWRSGYFADYFAEKVHYYKSITKKNYWVVDVCGTLYIVHEDVKTETWRKKKATKDESLAFDLKEPTEWVFFEKGFTPKNIMDAYPDTFKTVQECPDWVHLAEVYPTYKGGRRTNWDFETTYKQFKDHSRGLTYNLGNTLGLKVVATDWAEFDDIAHSYAQMYKDEPMIIVTTDQDLDQLHAVNHNLQTWNPGSGANNPARWQKLGPRGAQYHLFCKLIGGDSSDGIPPVTLNLVEMKGRGKNKHEVNKQITYPVVQWDLEGKTVKKGMKTDKLVMDLVTGQLIDGVDEEQVTPGKIDAWLRAREVNGSYTRNVALMHLGACPLPIQEACKKSILEAAIAPPKYTLADFLLTEVELREVEHEALIDRKMDQEKGIY